MPTSRKTLTRRPAATLSSRVGDMLLRRRGVKQENRAVATSQLSPDNPQVVVIPAQEEPLSDILAKSRFESRPPRTGDYAHVSDLIARCVRKVALQLRYDMPVSTQSLSLTDSLTFAQGDAIHDVVKARAAQGKPSAIWGNWKCRCGTTKTLKPSLLSEVDASKLCAACKTSCNVYEEVPMRNKEHMIVGTPDLLLYLSAFDAFYITELKSIAHDKWKDLVRPDPEHVIQVVFYWFLMNSLGYRLTNRVSILYVTKGWMFSGSPYKEFTIDAQSMQKRLEPHLEDARALMAAKKGVGLPVRVCASEQDPKAKKCEACTVCFKDIHNAPKKINIRHVLSREVEKPPSSAGDRPVTQQHRVRVHRTR